MCRICMQKDIPIGNIFIESERLERTYLTEADNEQILTAERRISLATRNARFVQRQLEQANRNRGRDPIYGPGISD